MADSIPQINRFNICLSKSVSNQKNNNIFNNQNPLKMSYNFRGIKTIPSAPDMINIVLSKTQRKTPTVVHPGYAISRIRSFYMRKIKFCENTISDRLSSILETFPKVEEVHPFYSDLFNVLYDRDHYKLALGHVKSTKNMLENMGKDYLKLVKYGDSLYRCKSLKRAAMGRMCTMLRKIGASLQYLEEVRKHLSRLPSINPYEKTLLLTGYPNVGKSSFINTVSKANVQVQPYPFTTQALYVGHFEYKSMRFQVIDSPGVLNHKLEEMNTIEMQAVTALAHLKACVIFFVDPSQMCGYSLPEQIQLFERISPLFKNKPLLIAFNKADLKAIEDLEPEKLEMVQNWLKKHSLQSVSMTTKDISLKDEGVRKCKELACQKIISLKTSSADNGKMPSSTVQQRILKLEDNYIQGMYVSEPKKRDSLVRAPVKVDLSLKKNHERPNIAELEEQNGGAGVFNIPLQQHYTIPEEWRYDAVPEFYNGKNIGDFVDSDIWERLQEIEKEEDLIVEMEGLKMQDEEPQGQLGEEEMQAYSEITRKRHAFREEHFLNRRKTAHPKNRKLEDIKQVLEKKGLDSSLLEERVRNRSRSKSLAEIKAPRKRKDSSDSEHGDMVDEDQQFQRKGRRNAHERLRSLSRSRSKGYKRELSVAEVHGNKVTNKLSKKWRLQDKKGQADRFIGTLKPKHLFSGKSSNGKRDWR